jgi:tryptophan-rich sensory protein
MIKLLQLIVSLMLPLGVGALSGIATSGSVRDWYPGLTKPPFNPPPWVFGPVWTVLYVMMGVAFYLVWREGLQRSGVRAAMVLFLIQLALNGLWSLLFFGLASPGLALVDIGVLWALIALTVVASWRVVPLAGVLLLPYLAWVSFAAVLNASIWWLNR